MKKSKLCVSQADHIDDLVTEYNETLLLLFDKHAPVTGATRVKTIKRNDICEISMLKATIESKMEEIEIRNGQTECDLSSKQGQ